MDTLLIVLVYEREIRTRFRSLGLTASTCPLLDRTLLMTAVWGLGGWEKLSNERRCPPHFFLPWEALRQD